ncbi:aryl-sulfate sulfotransferase [Maribacter sp. 2308TA10-17]|uniref:aryl-sulfate sulfotransferase n=1 Tax=Maribacter sp. 2308TA10-17 TaxID=3386276 RepID=UPI0039BC8C31
MLKNLSFCYFLKFLLVFAAVNFIQSCSKDDSPKVDTETSIEDVPIPEEPEEEPSFMPVGSVEVFLDDKVDDNYILVNDAASNQVYLMDKEARLLHEWSLTNNIGNDVFLLPNGQLLASLEADDPQIKLGGKGGKLQLIGPNGAVEWDYLYSSMDRETHHDAELLPNGNIIAMVWTKHSAEEALQSGFMFETDVFVESIIEIDPNTDEIVWEWHSWDHIVQDHDSTKNNYGNIADHPERIDVNYVPMSNASTESDGDIMHANGIAYDKLNDAILLSVNFFSEVWVIDHSTSTEEASTSSGGNYGKGGDLIYRFGNPETYKNTFGERQFYNNHFPNLLKGMDLGKLLIFSNGFNIEQSTVYELELPSEYDLKPDRDNELNILWSYTNPDLYSGKISGAVTLPNGNVLITEGDFGFWEVTREKEVVWKFSAEGFFWRGYSYAKDAPEIKLLGL